MPPVLRLATDMGGTFTDLVIDDGRGGLELHKAPTTPEDPVRGVLDSVDVAAAARGTDRAGLLRDAGVFVHATTRALNAMLTGRTARTALLTTAGHPDVLLFREGGRADPFDLAVPYPEPFVPRSLTFEVPERMLPDGTVRRPLDEDAVVAIADRLRERAVEAVAVCLLWSVVAPAHERRVGQLLAEHLPGVPVTLSHQLNPTLREYRRASSTAIDAALKPTMSAYVADLDARLRADGFGGETLLVSSTGGTLDAPRAAAAPIHLLGSGPAMAPVASRRVVAAAADRVPAAAARTAIVFDTGGTSCDVSLVRDGTILTTRETWIGPIGLGHITGFDSVDVRSIAAGGGSVAWVDDGGLLRVGPRSAGADPGPACYGRGGVEPTLTDAALLTGRIDPDFFLGGALPLDADAARAAFAPLAVALGRDPVAVALATLDLATEQMAAAVESITLRQGIDPRRAVLVGGGGAAGLNAVAIARRLGTPSVVVPAIGAALSAAGALISPLMEEHAVTAPTALTRLDRPAVAAILDDLRARCAAFAARHADPAAARIELTVEARYRAQVWEIEVPLDELTLADEAEEAAFAERFHAAHERTFGVHDPDGAIELLTWHGRVRCPPPGAEADAATAAASSDLDAATATVRPLHVRRGPDAAPVDARVWRWGALVPGTAIDGPAIVESPVTTVVLPPGATAVLTAAGDLVIDPGTDDAPAGAGSDRTVVAGGAPSRSADDDARSDR
ncbi:hydantoinase/oxoprolinase family protein [Patulibacter defluvii]|uniref:hydantoinase/oxoprolinase family protein n=1 Tax=Patulibacter defluvii TaxID=3095358 RepID=UPI002A763728|nr:hydantoinase/oxoprolinase family protein [Patulibacter sp. DM4]